MGTPTYGRIGEDTLTVVVLVAVHYDARVPERVRVSHAEARARERESERERLVARVPDAFKVLPEELARHGRHHSLRQVIHMQHDRGSGVAHDWITAINNYNDDYNNDDGDMARAASE